MNGILACRKLLELLPQKVEQGFVPGVSYLLAYFRHNKGKLQAISSHYEQDKKECLQKAVQLAAFYDRRPILELLLQDDPSNKTELLSLAMLSAVDGYKPPLIHRIQTDEHYDPNRAVKGLTPLMHAAQQENDKVTKLLLTHKEINCSYENSAGDSAISYAKNPLMKETLRRSISKENDSVMRALKQQLAAIESCLQNSDKQLRSFSTLYARQINERVAKKTAEYNIFSGLNTFLQKHPTKNAHQALQQFKESVERVGRYPESAVGALCDFIASVEDKQKQLPLPATEKTTPLFKRT